MSQTRDNFIFNVLLYILPILPILGRMVGYEFGKIARLDLAHDSSVLERVVVIYD